MRRLLAGLEREAPKLRVATLAMFLLLEPASCSGSGKMEKMGEEKEKPKAASAVAGLVITKTSQFDQCLSAINGGDLESAKKSTFEFLSGKAKKEERKAVFDAFVKKFGPDEAAKSAFEFLRESNAPKQQKYQVMDALVDKYGKAALQLIYARAVLDFGMDYYITSEELPSKYPQKLSYMQTLGYGFSKFGVEGFLAAEQLIANMDKTRVFDIPLFSNRENPLSELLVNIVCIKLTKDGVLNPQGTIDYLVAKYLLKKDGKSPIQEKFKGVPGMGDPSQSLETKGAVLTMIELIADNSGKIDKVSLLEGLLKNPNLDNEARALIEEDLKLRGKGK